MFGSAPTANINITEEAHANRFEKTLLKSYNVRQDEMKMKKAEKWKP